MKHALGGILLLTAVACSSSSDGDPAGGGAGGNTGNGTGGTTACGSSQPSLLYTAPSSVVRGPAVDDQFVYFVEGVTKVNKIPKTGGSASTLTTNSSTGFLDMDMRVHVDGSKVYYSDNTALYSLDKAGGAPTAIAMSASTNATGIHPVFAFDNESIYFGDRVSTSAGAAIGTVNKVPKSGGTSTVLAMGQASPSSVALDDTTVYWINEGTIDTSFKLLNNGGIGSVAKTGGTARALFTEKPDGGGVSPDSGELLVSASKLYFSNTDLVDFSNTGEYELAKTGGTPAMFSDCPTYGAFLLNGAMYADCGDSITKFDLATGVKTDLVCFPTELEGSVGMTHDGSNIYYAKAEHAVGGANPPYAIYSIPLE